MTHRDWTDPRDGKHWLLWLEQGERRGVLASAADGKQFTAEVRSDTPLADVTDNELEALLDRARGVGGTIMTITSEVHHGGKKEGPV